MNDASINYQRLLADALGSLRGLRKKLADVESANNEPIAIVGAGSAGLACARDLNIADRTLNLDGGAIALGHPLGATGARIVGKAAALLRREGGRYALATQCIGGGQGVATILEAMA